MSKFNIVKVIGIVIGIGLLAFGQNCSKGFQTVTATESSSTKSNSSNDPDPVPLSEAEKLGLNGRIPADEFMFPMDGQVAAFPTKLSETSLFKNLVSLEPATGLIPYEVNMPLWSDGSLKKRWYALPEGSEKIVFSATGNWVFPKGSVLVKHFELRLSATVIRRLETRVFVNETAGWKGYTYKWNDDQLDATLLDGVSPIAETFTVEDIMGTRQQTWTYPSRAQCTQCHVNNGFVNGMRTVQLNKFITYGGGSNLNQLQVLKDLKLISTDMPDVSTLGAFPRPENIYASLESKARAYLSVNCGTCHQGPTANAGVRLNAAVLQTDMNIINVAANNTMGLPVGAVRVMPGDRSQSTLYLRMTSTEVTRMPKVGSSVLDTQGLAIVGDWIDSL